MTSLKHDFIFADMLTQTGLRRFFGSPFGVILVVLVLHLGTTSLQACVTDDDCAGDTHCDAMSNCNAGACSDFSGVSDCAGHTSKCTSIMCGSYTDSGTCEADSHCNWNSGGHGFCEGDGFTDPVCYYSATPTVPEMNHSVRNILFMVTPLLIVALFALRRRYSPGI